MSGALPRLLFVGIEGTVLGEKARALLEELRPGGVVLFARNIESLEQTQSLIGDLKRLDPELLVAIDQEGGAVDRLRPLLPGLPSAMALGVTRDAELCRRAGRATGETLALLGVDLDFAPVCDLAASGIDNAIGIRSFGPDPDPATVLLGAFLAGLESRGVAGCLKHFPGLGGAPADSHQTLPVVPTERTDLLATEGAVYSALLPGAHAVMVSHGYYPHLTQKGAFPASLSEEVITLLLKGDLAFAGAVFTDDLVMGALAAEDIGQAAVRALAAGADALLVCDDEAKMRRVAEATAGARIGVPRIEDAVARLGALRRHTRSRARTERQRTTRAAAGFEARIEGLRGAMSAIAVETAEKSVARTRHSPRERIEGPVLVLRPRVKWLSEECARPLGSPFLEALGEARQEAREMTYDSETLEDEVKALLAGQAAPRSFLLATYDAHRKPAVARAAWMLATRAPIHHLALSWPDDLSGSPVKSSVSSFGCGREAVLFASRVLLGLARPQGKPLA